MRASELAEFGLDNLKLVERAEPEPGPGQVTVRAKAASLNSRDLKVIYDKYGPNQRLPIVPVSDGVAPRESYESMYRAMDATQMRPVVDREYDFTDAVEALVSLRDEGAFGKICINVG